MHWNDDRLSGQKSTFFNVTQFHLKLPAGFLLSRSKSICRVIGHENLEFAHFFGTLKGGKKQKKNIFFHNLLLKNFPLNFSYQGVFQHLFGTISFGNVS